MFDKILIANRGEIAVRVARTCRELGVRTVAVFSDVDERARHVASADERVHLPGVKAADTYLDAAAIVDAALASGAEAIHPGYGFLAESAAFAEKVIDAGITWVGPPPEAARAVGDKISGRRIARSAGVPVVPGLLDGLSGPDDVVAFAEEHGYPVAIKAAAGGGGRGLRVVHAASEVDHAFATAMGEARSAFGSNELYVERYLEAPKHLEVQILAPGPDDALWLGVRDCSLQRRHQKLVEETPPPGRAPVEAMGAAAVAISRACHYVGAGTVEMLVDAHDRFYFLEVNARLQVEHTVTEEVLGLDLVECQLRIASGEPLGLSQAGLAGRGHAIECRINAEDPATGFTPTPGRIRSYAEPGGPGVRVDSGYGAGDVVPEAYDSLVAKVIAWGETRERARRRMLRALDELRIEGIATTIPAHRVLLEDATFRRGAHTTSTVAEVMGSEMLSSAPLGGRGDAHVLRVAGHAVALWDPAMSSSASASVPAAASGEVAAPMQGTIVKVLVSSGERVEAGQPIAVLEAMKMETTVAATVSGTVTVLDARAGQTAEAGRLLARIE